MNWNIFFSTYIILQCLILGQIIAAFIDGRLYHGQMNRRGIDGYSLTDHAGIWFDAVVMSGLVALIVGKYHLNYDSWYGLLMLVLVIAAILAAGYGYSKAAVGFGEAHSHDGKTTIAGWLHGVYAIYVAWVILLVYFSPSSPSMKEDDLLSVSMVLTPFFFIGVLKFNSHWRFDRVAEVQTIGGPILLWLVTAMRIWFMHRH